MFGSQVRNRSALKGGLSESLFKLLSDAHPAAVVYLRHQYRMADDIMYLANKLVYQDQLAAGSAAVSARKLSLPEPGKVCRSEHAGCWLKDILHEE